MANRYWVGGTASWDGTAGTKWAASSNGPGGETVPTTADDVFFDASSTGTVTIAAGNTGAKSITCTGFAGTITGTAAITVAGSITLVAGMTYTHTGTVTITGTSTLTTAGKTFSSTTVDGVGITLTLGDALNIGNNRNVTVTRGTFDSAGFSITAGFLNSSNTNTRTISLNNSTLNLFSGVDFTDSSNLTFNASTSQINISSSTGSLTSGSAVTFYNVSFTGTSTGSRSITAGTLNDLSLTASATGLTQLAVGSALTINGTLTCAGSSALARANVRSSTFGTARTITAAVVSANDCDFRDITIAGAAAPISPTRAGDCGGNSGITFPGAKTVYRVGTATSWGGASSWATGSGATGSDANFPLPQDTAVINEDTALTGTLSVFGYNMGSVDASSRTTGITFSHSTGALFHGSYILGSGVTVTGTASSTFLGRGTQTFTCAGKTISFPFTVLKPAGAFELGDAFSSSSTIDHSQGTFDAKTYNLTCSRFSSRTTTTRTITMGSGLWTLSGTGVGSPGSVWDLSTTTNLTFNKNTANILFSNTSTSARNFHGGGLSYNKFTIGGATGTSTLTIQGVNTFTELASTKTVAHTIQFVASQTIGSWTVTGTAGNVVTVNSSSAGVRRTITLTNATTGIDYLSVKDIGIADANRFYVGVNSTDGGNNLNVIFTAPPPPGPATGTNGFFFLLQGGW